MKKDRYLNLDKNQLADKRKKIQFEDSCKEASKKYSESKKHESDCKIKNGTVKNISKKILMGSIVFVLSTATLTGCKAYGFSYKENNEGIRYATGTVDNKYINNCYVIEIYNNSFDNYEYYMTVKEDEYDQIKYLDVFTLDIIYVESDENYENIGVKNIISVDEYLRQNHIEQSKYSVEYMEELLEEMGKENKTHNKQLVK